MIVTEEQARTMWCPHARAANSIEPEAGNVSVNRVFEKGAADRDCLCLANMCMAWRWVADRSFNGTPRNLRNGYCGLAGQVSP